MSWDSYITTLTAHPQIDDAAIWGMEPGQEAQWATSPGLCEVKAEEIKKLACKNKEDLRCCGPRVGGVKCLFIRDAINDTYTLDLKTAKNERGEAFPVCVGFTNKAIVIAKGAAGASGGTLTDQVYKIVDYLKKSNY